jgi:microcompartment protein CcmL/EutN
MNEKSIGLIELSSIAAGFLVADTMLKAGNVRLLLSRSICSGKYMVLIGGDAAAIESAVAAGAEAANGCLIDSLVLANIHPDVITALGRSQTPPVTGALGVFESFNVATLVRGRRCRREVLECHAARSATGDGARRQGVLHPDRRCPSVEAAVLPANA